MDYIAMLEGVQMPGTGSRSLGRAYGRPFGHNSYRPFGRSFGDGPSCADPCTPRPNANCTPMPNANCVPAPNADCMPRGNANCVPRPNANCTPCSPPTMVFVPTQPFLPPPMLPPTQQSGGQPGGQPNGQPGGQPGGQNPGVVQTVGPFVNKDTISPPATGVVFNPNTLTLMPVRPFNPALLATPVVDDCGAANRNPDGSCATLLGFPGGRLGRLGRIFSGR